MTLRSGTSGFSYKQWRGSFYPEKLAPVQMLAYSAEPLPAVEINSTFYRMPKESVLASWASQVPEDFRFVLEASRRAALPASPNMKCNLERLHTFAALLPEHVKVAFEFRHESWNCDAVFELLRERNFALCLADFDEDDGGAADSEIVSTADWGYTRLRREGYSDAELADWSRRIQSQGWRDSFVFLKHEEQGPRLAATLLECAQKPAAKKVTGVRMRKLAAARNDDAQSARAR